MGRGTTRRPKPKESGRPSTFFIIALTVGIILLVWFFSQMIGKPARKQGMARIVPVSSV